MSAAAGTQPLTSLVLRRSPPSLLPVYQQVFAYLNLRTRTACGCAALHFAFECALQLQVDRRALSYLAKPSHSSLVTPVNSLAHAAVLGSMYRGLSPQIVFPSAATREGLVLPRKRHRQTYLVLLLQEDDAKHYAVSLYRSS